MDRAMVAVLNEPAQEVVVIGHQMIFIMKKNLLLNFLGGFLPSFCLFLNKINIKKYKDEVEKFDALTIKNRAKYKISKKTIDEIKDYCFLYLPMLTGMEKEAVGELLNEKYNINEMEIDIPNKLFFEDEEVKNEQKHWFQMYKMLFGETEIEEFKKEDLIPIAEDEEFMLFIERRTGEVYINIYELFFFCAISDSFDEFLDAIKK